jgi:hypothetical protein
MAITAAEASQEAIVRDAAMAAFATSWRRE